MSQYKFSVEALELDQTAIELVELLFVNDASYEYVGGGQAANGY